MEEEGKMDLFGAECERLERWQDVVVDRDVGRADKPSEGCNGTRK